MRRGSTSCSPRRARRPGQAQSRIALRRRAQARRTREGARPRSERLLLDEPLGALDRPLHDRLLARAARAVRRDPPDRALCDPRRGRGVHLGIRSRCCARGESCRSPRPRAWARPADAWVARFIGLANVEERGRVAIVTWPEGVVLRPDPAGDAVVVAVQRDGRCDDPRAPRRRRRDRVGRDGPHPAGAGDAGRDRDRPQRGDRGSGRRDLALVGTAGIAGHELVEHGQVERAEARSAAVRPRPSQTTTGVTPGPITVTRYFSPGAAGRCSWLG